MTQNVLITEHQASRQTSRQTARKGSDSILKSTSDHLSNPSKVINKNSSSLTTSPLESGSRIEFLERNLRFIQEQQDIVLVDLYDEIARLQQDNRDLHYQLLNNQPLYSNDQKFRYTNQLPSSSSSSTRPIHDNPLSLKQHIDKLERRLFESEQKNSYLMRKINELTKQTSNKREVSDANMSSKDDNQSTTQSNVNEYHNPSAMSHEKEQQYIHEINKLRSVLVEVLNAEQLNVSSKSLIRDCLTSTNINESKIHKATTTPVDMLFYNENQQDSNNSSSTTGKNSSVRPELPVRRLNLSPPRVAVQRLAGQHRPSEIRTSLPPIIQRTNTTLFLESSDAGGLWYNPLNLKNDNQNQVPAKIGETSIARRERATQELQKSRLMKNLYY